MNEVAAGARGNDHGEIAGAAIQGIVGTIARIAPGNRAAADARGIGIHGTCLKVDLDLPAGTAGQVGAIKDRFRALRTKGGRRRRGGAHQSSADPEGSTNIFSEWKI